MAEGCCQGAARVSRGPRAGREDKERRTFVAVAQSEQEPSLAAIIAPGTWQTAGLLSLDVENPTIPRAREAPRPRDRGWASTLPYDLQSRLDCEAMYFMAIASW
jgi:hypothetical protein